VKKKQELLHKLATGALQTTTWLEDLALHRYVIKAACLCFPFNIANYVSFINCREPLHCLMMMFCAQMLQLSLVPGFERYLL